MITRQYWAHKKSGDEYAVEIQEGRVIGACGPLHYEDRPQDMRDFEYSREDGEWINSHQDEFRLQE